MNLLQNVLFTKLISEGWDKRTATWYLKNKPSCTPDLKRYLALYPYNDLYGKWLIDKNISAKIYHDISSLFPKRYFLLYQKYHKQTIIDLRKNEKSTAEFSHVLALLQEQKALFLTTTRGLAGVLLSYEDHTFYKNHAPISETDLFNFLSNLPGVFVVEEALYSSDIVPICRAICVRDSSGVLRIGQCYEKRVDIFDRSSVEAYQHKNEINDNYGEKLYHILDQNDTSEYFSIKHSVQERLEKIVTQIGEITPQIQLCGVDFYPSEDGIKIVDMTDLPYYPLKDGFSSLTKKFIDQYGTSHHQLQSGAFTIIKKKVSTIFWMFLSKCFGKLPMRPLVFKEYFSSLKKDLLSKNGLSFSEKRNAYKWGFLSYRIQQYGITKENRSQFISDRQYCSLKHINTKYRAMLEDKISIKYILHDHSSFLPDYYYLIMDSDVNHGIVPLMDCPEEYINGVDGFFALLMEKKTLACKPQRGSHGTGFVRLDYIDNQFYMNQKLTTRHEIQELILNPLHQYLITEYIKLHPVLKRIFPDSVNTMRAIVFRNENGDYEIGNAYLRFGNKKTNGVDNMGAGGMFAAIDIPSGHFGNGKQIKNNIISPCKVHPDTKIAVEGQLPHWEQTKKDILSLCDALPELEYMGFDIALTEDGMKIPEINRSPDYPAIECLSRPTMDYLLRTFQLKYPK